MLIQINANTDKVNINGEKMNIRAQQVTLGHDITTNQRL